MRVGILCNGYISKKWYQTMSFKETLLFSMDSTSHLSNSECILCCAM